MFEGFTREWIDTGEAEIHLVRGGEGPPLLLLHGYPQSHVCWHKVAPRLAEAFSLVIPDLRGYGDSSGPEPDDGPEGENEAYSKRAMAEDMVEVMRILGHERFALAGHDRGGRVAYRLALDFPETVTRLATLDIVPTLEMAERVDLELAVSTYHWFFLAQPPPLPERLILGDPDFYLEHTLRSWLGPKGEIAPDAITPEALAEYRRCFRQDSVVRAACADYRAGLTSDLENDRADREAARRIACPLLALWGAESSEQKAAFDFEAIWHGWAEDVTGAAIDAGHFLMEEAPEETADALLRFFTTH
jgi:haloacetate dehalogenase